VIQACVYYISLLAFNEAITSFQARLALQPFEVDPDAEAALAASEGRPSNPQAAALMCGGPPKADNKTLDF